MPSIRALTQSAFTVLRRAAGRARTLRVPALLRPVAPAALAAGVARLRRDRARRVPVHPATQEPPSGRAWWTLLGRAPGAPFQLLVQVLIVPAVGLSLATAGCSDDDAAPDAGHDARLDARVADAGDGGADASEPDAGVLPGCLAATGVGPSGTETWTDGAHTATATESGPVCGRHFTLATTAPLRDNLPANPRSFTEMAGWPALSTNNTILDALYALALVEVRENSVASIQDGAYNDGNPISCPPGGCFETGRLWKFVWTRDTAYSVDLALGLLDPVRAQNSLLFKVSALRTGGSPEIVQDTGTGGSYPVSTDRAVWAFGAARLLAVLTGAERQAFSDAAWPAVRNTLERDRQVVFDPSTGLYFGEQSFLDWREQSYPPWTADDPVQIHMSQSLSTNLGHLALLRLGADLAAERGDAVRAAQYGSWADDLAAALHGALYLPTEGLWATYTTGTLDRAPVHRYDLLSIALAVLAGLGNPSERAEAVRRYPHLGPGAPVQWPQQKEIPIYHNRAIWPFVTAYFLRAARAVHNDAALAHAVRSLVRGAALNLSNMENFECVTGAAWLEDGPYSGPVVNSQRQLWSVAGFLAMVHEGLFGVEITPAGLHVAPYLPRTLRATLLAGADRIVLNRLPVFGGAVTVVVNLPPDAGDGPGGYETAAVRLDGQPVSAGPIARQDVGPESVVEVDLATTPDAGDTVTEITDTSDYRTLFGPLPPTLTAVTAGPAGLEVSIQPGPEPAAEVTLNVYRDGALLASDLPGDTTLFTDTSADADAPSHCYTAEAVFRASGTRSQHAKPACWWGPGYDRIQTFDAQQFTAVGGTLVFQYGYWHYQAWGAPGHTLTLSGVSPAHSGPALLQVRYGNGAGPISTGIACGIKRITVYDEADDSVVGTGVLVLPQLGTWDRWADSNFVPVTLDSSRSYRIVIAHDDTTLNMTDFAHNAVYTGGTGRAGGAFHDVNIAELKILALTGAP